MERGGRNAINSMEECRTDFINHIRVCLSLCVCVCVSIFDSRFLTPIYLFRIYTTVENKYSHRTRSIRISESKEIDGGIFIRMESIDRTVSEKSRDGLNSSRFLNSILADLLSFDSNFAISKSFRVSPLDFDFFFIIRREIREFSSFKGGGGGIRVHSSRVERSYWIGKFSAQQGSWEDGRQLARLGSFSRRWQPVPGEIFYLKKGMEIFLSLRTRKNKFVGYPPPPTARYFLVFRPTLSGDLVTWWNKEWRIQGTFEDFLRARGEQIYPLNLHITENFGKFLISRDT